jgi:hypothetical protein
MLLKLNQLGKEGLQKSLMASGFEAEETRKV